jgi:hypothetical protein
MAELGGNENNYQYYGKPIRHFSQLRSSSPRYRAIGTSRILLVSILLSKRRGVLTLTWLADSLLFVLVVLPWNVTRTKSNSRT